MNRRQFLQTSAVATVAAATALPRPAAAAPGRSVNRSRSKIAAYYLCAHIYTSVPRHVREDMEWMADKGTNYVCASFLEQDLFAAFENQALVVAEAERVGMQVIAVPSRWGGLTAGAPKVPSLFSVLNPQTWIVNEDGSTRNMAKATGAISSVHAPETMDFFCRTLKELYRQHPTLAGFVIDEPKCFLADYSKGAVAALGQDAPLTAHYAAVTDFFSRVCGYAKQHWPEKFTMMFQEAHLDSDELAAGAAVKHLDYYGADGRPWTLADDKQMANSAKGAEGGKGKVLLSGKGERFMAAARSVPGRKSFFLAENHNLPANMVGVLDRNYPAVLGLGSDLLTYYYYPRNVEQADRAMSIIGRHVKAFTQGA